MSYLANEAAHGMERLLKTWEAMVCADRPSERIMCFRSTRGAVTPG